MSLAPRRAALLGYLCGVVYFSANFDWFGETAGALLGPLGFVLDIGPAIVESIAFALAAAIAASAVQRLQIRWVPIVSASGFTLAELLRSSGVLGVPLYQIGVPFIGTPLAPVAAFSGVYGLTFVVALAAATLAVSAVAREGARSLRRIGATLLLPMDIRLAATTARFGFVFSRRGITPEAASSWFLPKLVGISTALEWCYSGRIFPADEAKERGLVRSLHEPGDLISAARAVAVELTEHSAPVSIALTRQMMWRLQAADHPMEAHKIDSRAIQARGASADSREGVGAFLEKRAAAFPDTVSADLPAFYPWWADREFE